VNIAQPRSTTAPAPEQPPDALCRPCRPDGDFGTHTIPDTTYLCPCCAASWSRPTGPEPRRRAGPLGRIDDWNARRLVRRTSRCQCWNR
jgi:hypothetical protein